RECGTAVEAHVAEEEGTDGARGDCAEPGRARRSAVAFAAAAFGRARTARGAVCVGGAASGEGRVAAAGPGAGGLGGDGLVAGPGVPRGRGRPPPNHFLQTCRATAPPVRRSNSTRENPAAEISFAS